MHPTQVFNPPLGSLMRLAYLRVGRIYSVNLYLGPSAKESSRGSLQKITRWYSDSQTAWTEAKAAVTTHLPPEATEGRSITLVLVIMNAVSLRPGEA